MADTMVGFTQDSSLQIGKGGENQRGQCTHSTSSKSVSTAQSNDGTRPAALMASCGSVTHGRQHKR